MDILERSLLVSRLSDQIAKLNRQMLDRAKQGQPENSEERRLLDELSQQLKEFSRDVEEIRKTDGTQMQPRR